MPEILGNFDIGLEEARAQSLEKIVSMGEYRFRRDAMVSYNKEQMVKGLGERFHVVLSRYEYDINNGELWGKDMDEPAINSFIRGRDHRREHGNPVDYKREEADVIGFGKIQAIMADRNTPFGTVIMSASQPGLEGSTYNDNFIDFHTKKTDENGRVFVESQRVSSGLTMDETLEKISAFATFAIDEDDPAASLLENPIAIENSLTAEDLKFYMYKDHDYMDERTFGVIIKNVSYLIDTYAESLVSAPRDKNYHRLLANTILNKSDEVAERIKIDGVKVWEKLSPIPTGYHVGREIEAYGYREVKEVKAGCGISGGFGLVGEESVKSVADFDPKKERILCCTCPFCKEKVEAVIKNGRIKCPRSECGKSAKWED